MIGETRELIKDIRERNKSMINICSGSKDLKATSVLEIAIEEDMVQNSNLMRIWLQQLQFLHAVTRIMWTRETIGEIVVTRSIFPYQLQKKKLKTIRRFKEHP